jgi:pimeloyl-ACP methyl ester carboxylesterase
MLVEIILLGLIAVCASVTTVSKTYRWQFNSNIHYTTTTTVDTSPTKKFPLLLLPGFGVGTFHYDRNIAVLAKEGYEVYSIDLLGQGKSWPENGHHLVEEKLCYSVDMWTEQIIYFIDKVIQRPVHIAGNSLGGYLSTSVSSRRSDLIKSVSLLNPTPFWGFQGALPDTERDGRIWDGVLPAPKWLFNFGSKYFDTLRNKKTVDTMLNSVYYSSNYDESLVTDIIDSASHMGGHEAFTSILFAPKAKMEYEEMIRNSNVPICLIMGKEDPWITPYWGQRVKRIKPTEIPYFELSNTGHCPHHESPAAVNSIIIAWANAVETKILEDEVPALSILQDALKGAVGEYKEEEGRTVTAQLMDGTPRNIFEKVGAWAHKLEIEKREGERQREGEKRQQVYLLNS